MAQQLAFIWYATAGLLLLGAAWWLIERALLLIPRRATPAPRPRHDDPPAARADRQERGAAASLPAVRLGARSTDVLSDAPLASLSLERAAEANTILVVGSRGSGKSVLIRALVGLKSDATAILDPHNNPGKWPEGSAIVGGGSNYPAMYRAMTMILDEMVNRSQQLDRGDTLTFARLLIAADEWGSITQECARGIARDAATPGEITRRLLKEGRKFGVSWIGGAHGDTAASLGSAGDTVAFAQSFDMIIYTGAFARDAMIRAGALPFYAQIPRGRTHEGNEFPLIVPVYRPTVGDWLLLDMRGAPEAPTRARPALDLGNIAQPAARAVFAQPASQWNAPTSAQLTAHEAALVRGWADDDPDATLRGLARRLYAARGGQGEYDGSGAPFVAVRTALAVAE